MEIKEIVLLSANLQATATFYEEVLEFPLIENNDEKISFQVGSSILTFKKVSDKTPVYHFAFDIPHNSLNESQMWISNRVDLIEFQGSPVIDFPNWNAKSLYFYDNNGNVLEFIARFNNENTDQSKFDSSKIVSISEIAFVTDNVEKLAQHLKESVGLDYFSRQIPYEDFTVLGDDNGLFILVKFGRNWFPTPIKAQTFPIEVSFGNEGREYRIAL